MVTNDARFRRASTSGASLSAPRLRGRSGERITHKLEAGEDAGTIAKRLTLRIYQQVRGDGTDFNRRLSYPRSGIA
jgi:hypothetical protein